MTTTFGGRAASASDLGGRAASASDLGGRAASASERVETRVETRPLGDLVYARSGDKGGDANIGLWIPAGRPDAAVEWLLDTVTAEWVRELLPETADLDIDLVPLPNLRGVNIVIHGILGAGVAEGVRFDPQAKALGEWLRSRYVAIPDELCATEQTA